MNVPLIVLFIPYALIAMFVVIRILADLYHVFRYAFLHRASLIVATLFLLAVVAVVSLTLQAVPVLSWNTSLRVTVPTNIFHPAQDNLP